MQHSNSTIPASIILALAMLTALTATSSWANDSAARRDKGSARLIEVATSKQYQWNGVAISPDGRVFASFPRWLSDKTISVGEILKDGIIRPFPGGEWNTWSPADPKNPGNRFVSVNAVFTDGQHNLWVVDPATPKMGPMVPHGPKLVQIDLTSNQVKRVYRFNARILPKGSSLNDVRIGDGHAYLTESGRGAIIVVDLATGNARRLLNGHPSTRADPQIVPVIEGKKMLDASGKPPKLNANDIELAPDGRYLLYQPTTGPRWFRVPTEALLDPNLSASQLAGKVEPGNITMPLGGTTMDRAGNIYLMDVERKAIWRQTPDGQLRLIVRDPRLAWPDASDIGPDGYLYVPVSQVHRLPIFNQGMSAVKKPFRLFKVKLPD